MSTIRDAIANASRLARMRQGQQVFEPVEVPSLSLPGEPLILAQIPLTESETQQGVIAAATLDVPDNLAGMAARNRAAAVSDLWHSLRDPADLSQKAFDNVEELTEQLTPTDVDHLIDALAMLMEYASPDIDGLSQKDLEELKKGFAEIDLSVLTGRQWAAVKLCFQVLLPELLQAKLSGSTSTESSTERSESVASI